MKVQSKQKSVKPVARKPQPTASAGPSLYEMEYLQQLVDELNIFLHSKSVSTVNGIYLGFKGDQYRGRMLLSR
jgi:hypothetical protein